MMRGGEGGDERHGIIKIKIMEINRAGALGVDEHLPASRGPKEWAQGPPREPLCWDPRSAFRGLAVPAGSCRPRGGASLRVHTAGHRHMAGNAKDMAVECTPFPGRKPLAEPVLTREDA